MSHEGTTSISTRAQKLRATEIAVRVSGLAKTFYQTRAVDTIDFVVPQKALYGIVGPNGAGKTTTMLMASGLLRPETGRVTVLDHDVWTDQEQSKSITGIMPDRIDLFERLTGWQLLHYAGTLRGLSAEEVKERSAELVKIFGLERAAERLVSTYSGGMTKKISLACAVIHKPAVLILDEPFEGVDPVSTEEIIDYLKELVKYDDVTVMLSSHNIDLIDRHCDHVAIIVEGRVLEQGAMADVKRGKSLAVRFKELVGSTLKTLED